MEKILALQQEFIALSASLENNTTLAGKPNKAAIRRARKNLMDIKKLTSTMREAFLTYQKSL